MEEYIASIRKSLDDKNYHAALFIALSIPDICGKLETPDVGNGGRAKRWFSENLGRKYTADNLFDFVLAHEPAKAEGMPEYVRNEMTKIRNLAQITPKLFWDLRNAFLHEASDLAGKTQVHITHSKTHIGYVNGDILISAIGFCEDMCLAACEWLERMKDNPEVWERISSRAKIKNSILNGMIQVE
ncbi:hypothetical protein M8S83_02645 [Enterobacter asburiae]|jgi:hypothetical protein|uniref:hypothetical protein n=1 Tax=Enterobacter asburiae TaxID=61645 RepID=UPI002074EF6D|nr:hypothetical protein [Enterobacter asburiae]MCM7770999.1 hypothetical protein [Enterobacter asburiae]